MLLRLVLLGFTTIMTVVTLGIAVTVLLGVGWLAVAVPVLIVVGVVAAGRRLWRRYRGCGPPDGERL